MVRIKINKPAAEKQAVSVETLGTLQDEIALAKQSAVDLWKLTRSNPSSLRKIGFEVKFDRGNDEARISWEGRGERNGRSTSWTESTITYDGFGDFQFTNSKYYVTGRTLQGAEALGESIFYQIKEGGSIARTEGSYIIDKDGEPVLNSLIDADTMEMNSETAHSLSQKFDDLVRQATLHTLGERALGERAK